MESRRIKIESGVRGPGGEVGFLLIAPPSEALDWDIQHEIGSTSRSWVRSRQAWWIAAPYLPAARLIAERLYPGSPRSARGRLELVRQELVRLLAALWHRVRALVQGAGLRVAGRT